MYWGPFGFEMKFPVLLTAHRFSELVYSEADPIDSKSPSYSTPDADVWPVPPHLTENDSAMVVEMQVGLEDELVQ